MDVVEIKDDDDVKATSIDASSDEGYAMIVDSVVANAPRAVDTMKQMYTMHVLNAARQPLISDDSDLLSIVMQLKTMPNRNFSNRFVKFDLPHPLHSLESARVCMIVPDDVKCINRKAARQLDRDACARQWRQRLSDENITGVDLILSESQLRREYITNDAKMALARTYDVFLVDRSIHTAVFRICGQNFQQRSKYPQLIDANAKGLGHQITKAIQKVTFVQRQYANRVNCKIGRATMSSSQLLANIDVAIKFMLTNVFDGWSNVRTVALMHARLPNLSLFESQVATKVRHTRAAAAAKHSEKQQQPTPVCDELIVSTGGKMSSTLVTINPNAKISVLSKDLRPLRIRHKKFADEEDYYARERRRTTKKIQTSLALAKVKKGKRRAATMIKKKTIPTAATKKKNGMKSSIDIDKKEEIDV